MTTTTEAEHPTGRADWLTADRAGGTDVGRPVIELAGVERVFAGPAPVRALAGVDLRIGRGEYVAITGRSGSGKSTLLNVLGLLDRPTGGSYYVDGTDTARLKSARVDRLRARMFGFVFQAFHLVDYLTTAENIELGLTYTPLASKARHRRVSELLDRVELTHRRDARTATLSGGERQRVAIARALVHRPAVLLADEPTGNLDEETSWSILELFGEINTEGVTVIVVTHDAQTAACANRTVIIRDGAIAPDHDPTTGAASGPGAGAMTAGGDWPGGIPAGVIFLGRHTVTLPRLFDDSTAPITGMPGGGGSGPAPSAPVVGGPGGGVPAWSRETTWQRADEGGQA